MLLAIPSEKVPLIIAIAIVLVLQFALALWATTKLWKNYKRRLGNPLWHLIVQIIVIVGPIVYILLDSILNRNGNDFSRKSKSDTSDAIQSEQKSEDLTATDNHKQDF